MPPLGGFRVARVHTPWAGSSGKQALCCLPPAPRAEPAPSWALGCSGIPGEVVVICTHLAFVGLSWRFSSIF